MRIYCVRLEFNADDSPPSSVMRIFAVNSDDTRVELTREFSSARALHVCYFVFNLTRFSSDYAHVCFWPEQEDFTHGQ